MIYININSAELLDKDFLAVLAHDAEDALRSPESDAEAHWRTVVEDIHVELPDAERVDELLHIKREAVKGVGEALPPRGVRLTEAGIVGRDAVKVSL